jgi:hypothetical protein
MRPKLCFVTALAVLGVLQAVDGPSSAQAQVIRGMPEGIGAVYGNRWLFEPPYDGGANLNETPTPNAYDVYQPVNPYLWQEYYPAYRPYRYRYRHYGPATYDRSWGSGSPASRYGWW